MCGTKDYLAPEMCTRVPYNAKVDTWTVGVLAYEFLHGTPPFAESQDDVQRMRIQQANFHFPKFSNGSSVCCASRLGVHRDMPN
jgi:aurora kinase, other